MNVNKLTNILIGAVYAGIVFMLLVVAYFSRPRSFEEKMYVKRNVKHLSDRI